ncbi:MAG: leucine-rich repeat domain-containing protein [Chlamydiota bacterium]
MSQVTSPLSQSILVSIVELPQKPSHLVSYFMGIRSHVLLTHLSKGFRGIIEKKIVALWKENEGAFRSNFKIASYLNTLEGDKSTPSLYGKLREFYLHFYEENKAMGFPIPNSWARVLDPSFYLAVAEERQKVLSQYIGSISSSGALTNKGQNTSGTARLKSKHAPLTQNSVPSQTGPNLTTESNTPVHTILSTLKNSYQPFPLKTAENLFFLGDGFLSSSNGQITPPLLIKSPSHASVLNRTACMTTDHPLSPSASSQKNPTARELASVSEQNKRPPSQSTLTNSFSLTPDDHKVEKENSDPLPPAKISQTRVVELRKRSKERTEAMSKRQQDIEKSYGPQKKTVLQLDNESLILVWPRIRNSLIDLKIRNAIYPDDNLSAEGIWTYLNDPDNEFEIHAITELDLSCIGMTHIPEDLIRFENLVLLNLECNQLISLPIWILYTSELKILFLNNNKLKELPNDIFDKNPLENLDISNNQLEELPKNIFKLKKLKNFNLANNKISKLPNEFIQLTDLIWLNLSHNPLAYFPYSIHRLENLRHLYFNGVQINELPKEFSRLKNLEVLELSHNDFASWPNSTLGLKNLTMIDLSHNCLTTVPAKVCNYKKLKRLNVQFNQLKTLPPELFKLKNLLTLIISQNQITTLPKDHPPTLKVINEGQSLPGLKEEKKDSNKSSAEDLISPSTFPNTRVEVALPWSPPSQQRRKKTDKEPCLIS